MPGNYKPRREAFTEILNGPEIRAALEEVTAKAQRIATGLSENFRITGDYIDGLETQVEVEPVEKGVDRLVGRLNATSGHSAAVEWGYKGRANKDGQDAHHVLKRTLEALGGE